jgi:hypothetical protein
MSLIDKLIKSIKRLIKGKRSKKSRKTKSVYRGKKNSPLKRTQKRAPKGKKKAASLKTARKLTRVPSAKKVIPSKDLKDKGKGSKGAGADTARIGEITHYFSRISVCVIKLRADVRTGDVIYIKGATTDFKQKIKSLQIESVDVKIARKGNLAGLKVAHAVRAGDRVYKVG